MARKLKKIKKDTQLTLEAYTHAILQALQIDVRFNTILQRMEYTSGREWKPWTDADDLRWLEVQAVHEHADLKNRNKILEAIAKQAQQNEVNPIREYLLNCPSDWTQWCLTPEERFPNISPVPTVGRIIAEYIESPLDKTVIAEVFDAWLVGCFLHGTELESNRWAGATICPILVGPQGCNKSRFTSWLGQAAGKEYYNESIIDADNKDNRIALATTWIWAADEFSGTMIKSKSETIKNFLSRKIITERLPYAKRVQTLPRLASLIGTDNEARPLRDTTGNRRFAVIPVERIRLEELQNVLPLDRLWGGVPYLLYLNQTPVVQGNAQIIINDVNEDAVEHDQWSEILLEKLVFDEFGKCTSSEIFSSVLGVCIADQDQAKKRRLGQILNSLEFKNLGVRQKNEWHGKIKRRIWKGCKI